MRRVEVSRFTVPAILVFSVMNLIHFDNIEHSRPNNATKTQYKIMGPCMATVKKPTSAEMETASIKFNHEKNK